MPASAIAAAVDKYNALPPAAFPGGTVPPLYFGDAPQTDGVGAEVRPPYCILLDEGMRPEKQSDNGGPEEGGFLLTLFDFDLGNVSTAALAVRFAGQPPEARAGFDGGTLTLDAPLANLLVVLTDYQFAYSGIGRKVNGDLARVHKCDLAFAVTNEVAASG